MKTEIAELWMDCGREDAALRLMLSDMPEGESLNFEQSAPEEMVQIIHRYMENLKKHHLFPTPEQNGDAIHDLCEHIVSAYREDWDNASRFNGMNLQVLQKVPHNQDSGTDYFLYPRWTEGRDEPWLLVPAHLIDTDSRCCHEYDCCGCVMRDEMTIVAYDNIRDCWILAQHWYRNI